MNAEGTPAPFDSSADLHASASAPQPQPSARCGAGLPAGRSAQRRGSPWQARAARSAESDGGRTRQQPEPLIMIVEDDPDSALLLEELLQDAGFRTVWHVDGTAALGALDAGAEVPALILLDLRMPNMDGWAFRVEQRQRPRLRDIPVGVMSADDTPQAAAIDADFFLPKPLDTQRVVTLVQEALLSDERDRLMATGIELERLRSLGMLLGSVAHELSGPLQYVIGFLEVAERGCLQLGVGAAPIGRAIAAAQEAAEGMRELVRDLRIFSRSESEVGEADPAEAIEAAVRLSEARLRSTAKLETRWASGLPRVIGNEARLSQVFLNLLTNAAQAIGSGTPGENTIIVEARVETREQPEGARGQEPERRVVIEVTDTGSGMSPEVLARAFEPFFTTKSAEEGTGIGLSFCRHVVEGYGGTISARSQLGHGTTMRVELLPVGERT
jgi:signal transduction histidine kinase